MNAMLIVCFIALILAVVISMKFDVNVGFVTYALAFLVGGWGLGLSASTIIGYFPVSLFFQLMVITLFYGFAISNGTMQKIADYSIYLCRNHTALIPWVIFVLGFVLCAIGCPPPGLGAILVALSVSIQKRTNTNHVMMIMFPSFGAMAGGFMPYGLFSTIVKGLLVSVGGLDSDAAAEMMTGITIIMIIFELLSAIAVYIFYKGYKNSTIDFEKPEPFTGKQKATLGIILGVVILLVVPGLLKNFIPFFSTFTSYITIVSLSCIGAALCSIFKLADERDVIKNRIPWSLMIMVAGAVSLITVMTEAGLTDWLASLFTDNMTGIIAALMFCLLAGFMSFFVDSTGVVLPLFIPIALTISNGSGIAVLYIAALCVGSYAAGNCPISTGGAVSMSQTPEESRQKTFYQVWIWSFVTLAIALIVTLVAGLFPWN